MRTSKQQDILVCADMYNTLNAVRTVISQCHWKLAKAKQNIIVAATGMSWTSYGETITIMYQVVNNGIQLNIRSENGWSLVDFGKNGSNIKMFIENLSRILPVYCL